MSELTALANIGKTLADRIELAGITAKSQLKELGAEEVFIRVKSVYPDACINHLYAIEGAVQNIRWHNLSSERKKELKSFYDSLA